MLLESIKNIFSSILDLVFPDSCLNCGKTGSILCNRCLKQIKPIPGQSIHLKQPIEKVLCYTSYSGIMRKIITKFKFENKKRIAETIANLMSEMIINRIPEFAKMSLLAVPLHASREKERSFNQALLLARNISKNLNIPCIENVLIRNRATNFMHKLNKKERMQNIKNAFTVVDKQAVSGKDIIIIDDIMTTGATLTAIAAELKKSGCNKVYGATAAMATLK